VDQIVAVYRRCEADHGDGQNARALADCGQDEVQRLTTRHERSSGVSHIHEDDERHHEGGAPRTELTAALNHLRYAEPWALRRMQRHEDRAGQVPDENRDNAREEGLAEDRRREGSGDDGQHIKIGAEPEGEQLACIAMPLIERDLVDGMLLDSSRFIIGLHGLNYRSGGTSLTASIVTLARSEHGNQRRGLDD